MAVLDDIHLIRSLGNSHSRVFWRALSKVILKYMPVATSMVTMIFCFTRSLGSRVIGIVEFFINMSPASFVFALASSHYMGFCRLHRHLIIYSFITDIFIYYERYVGFGPVRRVLNVVFFVWGAALMCRLVVLLRKNKY